MTTDDGGDSPQVETPEETHQAEERIHAHFTEIREEMRLEHEAEKKNPHAVALGKLGGLKSGQNRRARAAAKRARRKGGS